MKIIDLSKYEKKVHSQNGEDGIIEKIFEIIGFKNKYYVEIGTESGSECNTRLLRKQFWTGLMMDSEHHNPKIGLFKEFVSAENIEVLFEKYDVPTTFDLLSIDIDYNDFYVWNAITARYRPRVVIIEYNASHPPDKDRVVRYGPSAKWNGTDYFGASILALYNLGRINGYSLVYAEKNGVNLFFVADECLMNANTEPLKILNMNNVEKIYNPPGYNDGKGHPPDPHKRKYLSSNQLLTK